MLLSLAMLVDSAYGKSGIRLVKVIRRGDRHELRDFTVAVRFQGDYETSYTEGDNSAVLPTDTMKNTVYALAAAADFDQPEAFGLTLVRHFLSRNPQLTQVRVSLTDHSWRHLTTGDRAHGHAFMRRGPDTRTAVVAGGREGTTVVAGIDDLLILKSAHSAFAGFPRDEYTTLPETLDRILATSMMATWRYRDAGVDFGASWHAVRGTLLEAFATHDSLSVQHTLYAMAEAVLDAVAEVSEIKLVMPNKHHLPVDLSKFGLDNRNEIFVATEEPFGLIEATLARDRSASRAL
ncbi:MAG: factor-independent urate hydroxylase [Vicinamibacterales bacterium]